MTLVNNHVLLSDMPNMVKPLPWKRRWQTGVSTALEGNETRAGFKVKGLVELSWNVQPTDIPSQQGFEDRIRAAKKAGYACSAFWGRGQKLAANVNGTAVSFTGLNWAWSAGDYVFFLDLNTQTVNVRQFLTVAPYVLSVAVDHTFLAGSLCWPMIFGKFSAKDIAAQNPSIGGTQLTISELESQDSAQLGAVIPPAGTGIGVWTIGTTFIVGGS
ncbi:MAG: hypothetical protein JWM68_226 [Verrucomicrobiales bacterium]|nr:hypothetical protein [Verrucomicrobiales bacterium]